MKLIALELHAKGFMLKRKGFELIPFFFQAGSFFPFNKKFISLKSAEGRNPSTQVSRRIQRQSPLKAKRRTSRIYTLASNFELFLICMC